MSETHLVDARGLKKAVQFFFCEKSRPKAPKSRNLLEFAGLSRFG